MVNFNFASVVKNPMLNLMAKKSLARDLTAKIVEINSLVDLNSMYLVELSEVKDNLQIQLKGILSSSIMDSANGFDVNNVILPNYDSLTEENQIALASAIMAENISATRKQSWKERETSKVTNTSDITLKIKTIVANEATI